MKRQTLMEVVRWVTLVAVILTALLQIAINRQTNRAMKTNDIGPILRIPSKPQDLGNGLFLMQVSPDFDYEQCSNLWAAWGIESVRSNNAVFFSRKR